MIDRDDAIPPSKLDLDPVGIGHGIGNLGAQYLKSSDWRSDSTSIDGLKVGLETGSRTTYCLGKLGRALHDPGGGFEDEGIGGCRVHRMYDWVEVGNAL